MAAIAVAAPVRTLVVVIRVRKEIAPAPPAAALAPASAAVVMVAAAEAGTAVAASLARVRLSAAVVDVMPRRVSSEPACCRAHQPAGGAARCGVKPADERRVTDRRGGFTREGREDELGGILRAMGVAKCPPQRGGIHERQMPLHQLGEGIVGAGFD